MNRLVLLTVLFGCGSGGAEVDARGATRVVTVTMFREENAAHEAFPGVEICIRERPELPCVRSGSNGFAAMDVPIADISLSFASPGYERLLLPIPAASPGGARILMSEEAVLAAQVAAVGFQFPATPVVGVNIVEETGAVSEATATISVPAEGPVYARIGGFSGLDPTLVASDGGFAAFGDMAEGEIEITVTHPTRECTAAEFGGGWPTATPNRLRAPVVNGHDTVVAFLCF